MNNHSKNSHLFGKAFLWVDDVKEWYEFSCWSCKKLVSKTRVLLLGSILTYFYHTNTWWSLFMFKSFLFLDKLLSMLKNSTKLSYFKGMILCFFLNIFRGHSFVFLWYESKFFIFIYVFVVSNLKITQKTKNETIWMIIPLLQFLNRHIKVDIYYGGLKCKTLSIQKTFLVMNKWNVSHSKVIKDVREDVIVVTNRLIKKLSLRKDMKGCSLSASLDNMNQKVS